MEYPKVLIVCHNLYDVTNNIGKTLVSLMNGYPKDRIAQLYFRNETPSFQYSSDYYCITDKSVLKALMTFGIRKAGGVVEKKGDLKITGTENSLYKIGNRRHPSVSLIRDTLWSFPVWKSNKLRQWLQSVNPDIILFSPNDYTLAYRIALYVQKVINKPILPFYMDDAFYWHCKSSLIDRYRRWSLIKLAKQIHHHSNKVLTICDYMSEEYEKLFSLPCHSFVNSVHIEKVEERTELSDPVVFSYLGNLHSNRWKSLAEIGAYLREIQTTKGISCYLDIYSGSLLEDRILNAFDVCPNIRFKGSVAASEVHGIQVKSDILVHVESFDLKSVNSTRLSLSTKIPEYLSSGVPVFAYGPSHIASMRYLNDNNLAETCSSREHLFDTLLSLLQDKNRRLERVHNGLARVAKKHDIEIVSKDFQNIIIGSVQ